MINVVGYNEKLVTISAKTKMDYRKRLLWIDGSGGLMVGVLVLAFCRSIADWHNLPLTLIIVLGVANAGYGCYSLSLAMQTVRFGVRQFSLGHQLLFDRCTLARFHFNSWRLANRRRGNLRWSFSDSRMAMAPFARGAIAKPARNMQQRQRSSL